MNIIKVINEPKHHFPCVLVAPGNNGILYKSIPLINILVDQLPSGLDAIIISSDFQAYDSSEKSVTDRSLMGLVIAEEIKSLSDRNLLPNAEKTGIILAGDFYADPFLEKRGGAGDVQEVWKSFGGNFKWTVGVAGNHDRFDGEFKVPHYMTYLSNPAVLDGQLCEKDGLAIGGISGIIGNPNKPWRRTEQDFMQLMTDLANDSTILVLHEGPAIPEIGAKGNSEIKTTLDSLQKDLVLFSAHSHWRHPYYRINETVHAINADFRVVILTNTEINMI